MRTGLQVDAMSNLQCEVLVICSTYNHEKYIVDALEGFVKQQTTFPYIVLVHDDASGDRTAEHIKEYELRYPSIIKGIYDDENQYQQGKFFWYLDYLRRSTAKYIALCEGDDYWIAPNKLQLQYEALESNQALSYCFTNAIQIDACTGNTINKMLPIYPSETSILEKKVLNTIDLLKLAFIPTASFFSRSDAWLAQPVLPKEAFHGDRAHQIYLSLSGDAFYLDLPSCAYRINNSNSMMGAWAKSNEKLISVLNSFIELYKCFNNDTNGIYHDAVVDAMNTKIYDTMLITGDRTLLNAEIARTIAKRRGFGGKLKYYLFSASPQLYLIIKKLVRYCHGKAVAND